MKTTILVISPHPDDEAIGCGGTIRKHVEEGALVQVIFLTSGEKGGHRRTEEDTRKTREAEAIDAATILGTSEPVFWHQPDGQVEATEALVNRFVKALDEFAPNVVYVPHMQEQHPDHKAAARMVEKSLAELPVSTKKPIVWMYEVWTPVQQIDHIVDISAYTGIKRKAIQAHKCQCEVLKFDEAILGLNRYRGEMHSWPGGDYAEVFTKLI